MKKRDAKRLKVLVHNEKYELKKQLDSKLSMNDVIKAREFFESTTGSPNMYYHPEKGVVKI